MKHPNFAEEKKLWNNGYRFVAGLDEAGRGPLAGPVVAGAVMFNYQFLFNSAELQQRGSIFNKFSIKQFSKIKDSKQLTEKQREEIYEKLIKCKDIKWGVGIVSEKVIDKINILEATKLAMLNAVENLKLKAQKSKLKATVQNLNPEFLIIDGNFKIDSKILQKSIIKGDQKVFSIAAASIIAKVTRDRIMQKYHKKYPQYGFGEHKGYGTKAHFASLEKFGPCIIHRKTFCPVRDLL
jgi:ribonuclease HII